MVRDTCAGTSDLPCWNVRCLDGGRENLTCIGSREVSSAARHKAVRAYDFRHVLYSVEGSGLACSQLACKFALQLACSWPVGSVGLLARPVGLQLALQVCFFGRCAEASISQPWHTVIGLWSRRVPMLMHAGTCGSCTCGSYDQACLKGWFDRGLVRGLV